MSVRVLLCFALGAVLAVPLCTIIEGKRTSWVYPDKDTKRYCVFVIPPYQVSSKPKLEVIYCGYGSTQRNCIVDLQPGWIFKGLGDNIMECD